jgi:hypothetical protein
MREKSSVGRRSAPSVRRGLKLRKHRAGQQRSDGDCDLCSTLDTRVNVSSRPILELVKIIRPDECVPMERRIALTERLREWARELSS